MILESLIASATVLTLSSFWFANRVLKREDAEVRAILEADERSELRALELTPERRRAAAFAERRRILERERADWFATIRAHTTPQLSKVAASSRIEQVDTKLLELAKEEADG